MASDSERLANLFHAAARQRQLMQPWYRDKRFTADGGQLLHAVDTDVVKLYTAPEKHSVSSQERRQGYAQIFPEDHPNLSIELGRALASYVFNKLRQTPPDDSPLLLIPPMEDEVRRVFAAVAHDASIEQGSAREELERLPALRKLVDDLTSEADDKVALNRLAEHAPQLVQLLQGRRGPSAELLLLGRLLENTRIAPLQFALQKGWIRHPAFCEALAPVESLADRIRFRDMREAWCQRLFETRPFRKSTVNIYDDASALARLEWANAIVDEALYRVVLITGDSSIYRAGLKYIPKHRTDGKYSFSDLYLRHPRAYVAEAGVLSLDKDTETDGTRVETEFLDWLDTFLAKWQPDMQKYRQSLDNMVDTPPADRTKIIAPQLLRKHPTIVTDLTDKWAAYSRHIVFSYDSPQSADAAEDTDSRKLRFDFQTLLTRLSDQLADRVRETWDAFFKAATEASYGLIFYQSRPMRSRNVPALLFNGFEAANEFMETMLSSRAGTRRSVYDHKAVANLRGADASGYTYYVAHALLFAAEGRWRVADILADRALDIAQTRPRTEISGREAAYLRAVALRHGARRASDLTVVEGLLDRANACLMRERETWPTLHGGELRFEAERLALWLTYHLFGYFLNDSVSRDVPSLAKIQEEIVSLLKRTSVLLNKIGKREDRLVTRNVERNLLTNLFMTGLLRYRREGEIIDSGWLRHWFDRYHGNLTSREKPMIELSFLVQAVYLAARCWTGKGQKNEKIWQQNLLEYLQEGNVNKNLVFPYDKARFAFLRELATPTAKSAHAVGP